jgi:DNA invertase Pin-like site-specific DNA recombinase
LQQSPLEDLQAWRVSVIALNGLAFDLSTAAGRMMATVIAGVAQFECELIQERIRSGMAAARAGGRKLGRQPGQRPKSDRLAAKVIRMVEEEKLSYRIVAKRVDLSKNTVLEIMKRHRRADSGHAPAL